MSRDMDGSCEYEGCEREATTKAYDRRNKKVGLFCDVHYEVVVDADSPEYFHTCPNCGCVSGVN